MYTVWFKSAESRMSVDAESIDDARQIWDVLSASFEMLSTRP